MTKLRLLFAFILVWALLAALFGALWWLLGGVRRFSESMWWDIAIALAIPGVGVSWVLGQVRLALWREDLDRARQVARERAYQERHRHRER